MNDRKWLWRVGQVMVLALVLYGIYRLLGPELKTLNWDDFREWRPSPGRLILSLIALVTVQIIHALLWRRIVIDLNVGKPDLRTTFRVYFVASLGRYVPGKLWQIASLAVLSGRAGLSAGGAAAALLLGTFGFLATGLIFVAVSLPDWVSGVTPYLGGFLLVSAAGAIWVLTATPAGHKARHWIRSRLGTRTGQGLDAAFALADNMRPRDAIRWSVGYGFSWILLGIGFSLFATAFVPSSVAHTQQLAGTVAAAYLAGYVVIVSPAGLGVREGAMTAMLAAIPGFPIAAAVVVSVLSRVWFTIGEVLPLALVPVLPATTPPAAPTGPPSGGEETSRAQMR